MTATPDFAVRYAFKTPKDRLRHCPPRGLTDAELREAHERGLLSEQQFEVEGYRRERDEQVARQLGVA